MGSSVKKTIIAVVIFVVVMIGGNLITQDEAIVQPLKYSHKTHIEEAELECTDCHIYVEKNARATIPNIEICADCHSDEPLGDSAEEIKLLEYISNNKRIPWVQIYNVPDHVYFSHRRHVKIGELNCTSCHGNVAELIEPASHQLVKISMDNCIDCHRKHDVARDCIGCHI